MKQLVEETIKETDINSNFTIHIHRCIKKNCKLGIGIYFENQNILYKENIKQDTSK